MPTINLSSIHPNPWLRQFPDSIPSWSGWKFVFNADDQQYDYLVVFDDLHRPLKPNCPASNTIHLATEPPSVHRYDENFLRQFAWIITQDNAIEHSGKILHQPGLTWFIGWHPGKMYNGQSLNFRDVNALFQTPKSKLISVIASNKCFTPEHRARLKFALDLKKHYGETIDFYGRGFVPMDDKLDALKDYRFHVVLENSSHENYFSEKLTDCILTGTYPIYYGCPNLNYYFPDNSYLRIDIDNFEDAITKIDQAIEQSFDRKYRAELFVAREKTLYEHNLFPMLVNIISKIEKGEFGPPEKTILYSDELLPFGHEKFQGIFRRNGVMRPIEFLHRLASRSKFFGAIRFLYRTLRRKPWKM